MELWRELLISGLQNDNYEIDRIDEKILRQIVLNKCYKALLQIKQIIENEKLSDEDCFMKIEKIICALEENNILCGRHDFG